MKRMLFLLISLLPSFCVWGGCFQPADGINLWQLTAQLGSCVDVYSTSILDELAVVICSVGNVVELYQTDFSNDVIISQPGHYKICQNIIASTSVMINSSNVILDLGGFTVSGIGIIVGTGLENITIKNGFMSDAVGFIYIFPSIQNLLIQNLTLGNNLQAPNTYGIALPTGPAQGVTIRDVSFENASPSNIVLAGYSGNPVLDVIIENIYCNSTNQSLPISFLITQSALRLDYCQSVIMRSIEVTDPYQGLDCIYVTNSSHVVLDTISVITTLPLVRTPSAISIEMSNNIIHKNVNVSGAGFVFGFEGSGTSELLASHFEYNDCEAVGTESAGFLLSYLSNLTCAQCIANECLNGDGLDILTCDTVILNECTTNSNAIYGLNIYNSQSIFMSAHTALNNSADGVFLQSSSAIVTQGCFMTQNNGAGFNAARCTNLVIKDNFASQNTGQGVLVSTSAQAILKESSSLANCQEGFRLDMVDDVVVTGCEAQRNDSYGFFIKGVNGGMMPGDPEGTVGRSPAFVQDCSAYQNGNTGLYFTNVGGVLVIDCFASYNNNGYGFHFDTGCWNVQVEACYATSNALVGFITWDITELVLSSYNNRFHNCYASHNNTNFAYDPFAGLSDYAAENTPGLSMFPPIGAVFPASSLTAPNLFDVIPDSICGYQ